MPRYLGALLEIGLIVWCLIEAIQAPDGRIRNLPKWAWILLILFVPYAGPVAWLVAGRPSMAGAGRQAPWPSTQTAGFPEYERPRNVAPDDDPEFLAALAPEVLRVGRAGRGRAAGSPAIGSRRRIGAPLFRALRRVKPNPDVPRRNYPQLLRYRRYRRQLANEPGRWSAYSMHPLRPRTRPSSQRRL